MRITQIEVVLDREQSVEGGNVTIPPNKDVPEVRYLYDYRGGSLYQPRYIDVRDDTCVDDCVIAQLKYKKAVE